MQRHLFSILKQIVYLSGFLQCSVVTTELLYLCREKQKEFFIVNNAYGFLVQGASCNPGVFSFSTVFWGFPSVNVVWTAT